MNNFPFYDSLDESRRVYFVYFFLMFLFAFAVFDFVRLKRLQVRLEMAGHCGDREGWCGSRTLSAPDENNHLPTLRTTLFPLWEQPPSHFEDNHLSTLRTTIFPLWEHPPSHFENNHIPTLGKTTLREIFSNSWEQPEINHPWEQPHYHLENNQLPTLRTTSSVEEKYLYIY